MEKSSEDDRQSPPLNKGDIREATKMSEAFNLAPNGPLDRNIKGPLSPIGDPLGQILSKVLGPTVGHVLGEVGRPSGEALLRVQGRGDDDDSDEASNPKIDTNSSGSTSGKRIGGQPQTASNPLGL